MNIHGSGIRNVNVLVYHDIYWDSDRVSCCYIHVHVVRSADCDLAVHRYSDLVINVGVYRYWNIIRLLLDYIDLYGHIDTNWYVHKDRHIDTNLS